MMRMVRMMAPVLLWPAVLAGLAAAQTGNPSAVAPAATAATTAVAQPFDVKAAVDAYLAKVPREQRARSDAYFEGGYWLILWDFLSTAVVLWLLLHFRWSARMRDFGERITRFRPLQSALYWFQFLIVTSLLTFPLTVYEGYFREHKYGLSNQTFGPWMRDQAVMLAVGLVLGAPLIMALFGVVRRLGKNWWVWAAVVMIAFFAFVDLIAPVYIFPLFNTYTKLQDPHVKDPILSMARANGIPASEVYVFDASRQTKRISANVSGFAGTMRISLNDNLLNRCTLPEIEATMGHEMGHYVMNHQYKGLVFEGVLTFIGFAFLNWSLNACLARWGESWGVRGITDVAIVPVAALILSVYTLVLTPVENTITRTMEYEADIFGLNASQQPAGEAEIDLKLGEYRKLDPGPVEEFIFFDHPSGRTRITAAMRWKAEHLQPPQVQLVGAKP
jgi:STE24 endopeptidase